MVQIAQDKDARISMKKGTFSWVFKHSKIENRSAKLPCPIVVDSSIDLTQSP